MSKKAEHLLPLGIRWKIGHQVEFAQHYALVDCLQINHQQSGIGTLDFGGLLLMTAIN